MKKFTVLKLRTSRKDFPKKGGPFGEAYLHYQGGSIVDIVSESVRPGYPLERRGKDDKDWEQRVIADALGRVDAEVWHFDCLTEVVPSVNVGLDRTWLMVFSADID